MEIRGLEGAITSRDASRSASAASSVRSRLRRADDVDRSHDDVVVTAYEVLLEREPALVGDELRGDRVIGHGHDRHGDTEVPRQFGRHLGLGRTLCQPLSAVEVRREVAVAQAKPGLAAERVEFVHDPPRLVAQSPAEFLVLKPASV